MDLYIEIQGGVCQCVYTINHGDDPVKIHVLDFDNNPELNPPPLEHRKYLY